MQIKILPTVLSVVMMIILYTTTIAQNILVLQLPDPCFSTGMTTDPIPTPSLFQLSVNPNPAKDELTLTVSHPEPIGIIQIYITNLGGVAVSREQFFSSHQKWVKTIDISHFSPGIYIISAIRKGQTVSQKIIKY
jgi:hypothetical protein